MTVNKQDSNVTGLRYALETSYGVVSGSPVWEPLEPNSYSDFGGQITTVSRNPINSGRQRKKGVTTDLDASGGFNTDLTQTNLADLLQGFFFADYRRKGEEVPTSVALDTTNPDEYLVASTAGFVVGSLIQGQGFAKTVNNAVNKVTVVTTNTAVKVADGLLAAEASPPAGAKIVVVGFEGTAADLSIVQPGGVFPVLHSAGATDLTTLGLIPGEWIHVGGDGGKCFATPGNSGFCRIRSITATDITFDKTAGVMVAEAATGITLRLFFGRVLKNEDDHNLQVRRSFNLERTLGNDDDGQQAEYLTGSIPGKFQVNVPQANKITCDLTFTSKDNEHHSGADGLKAGTRPDLVEASAFNTSSDFARLRMGIVSPTDSHNDALFAFLTELTLTVDNNLSPNKAVSVLGAFEVTAGDFTLDGSLTAYFATLEAVQAVRDNADVTIDAILVKENAGVVFDIPLLTLGQGRLSVTKDQPITLPLSLAGASGAKVNAALNHTVLMTFFDYLPNLAA